MATIKSYTDVEQSKKLAEILPFESADYHYIAQGEKSYFYPYSLSSDAVKDYDKEIKYIPCWSLAALLDFIKVKRIIRLNFTGGKCFIVCDFNRNPWYITSLLFDNYTDACYDMILKLHELNLL